MLSSMLLVRDSVAEYLQDMVNLSVLGESRSSLEQRPTWTSNDELDSRSRAPCSDAK